MLFSRDSTIRKSSLLLTALSVIFAGQAFGQLRSLKLPRVPEQETFVNDYAGVISRTDVQTIGQLQQNAFDQFDAPIIVVTISSMAQYGGRRYTIEQFANAWFNHWQIGKRAANGETINQGILLLVSIGDRKARIELGADWKRNWDGHCQTIMDDAIIPAFKTGQYTNGILSGVRELESMAQLGPNSSPPANYFANFTKSLNKKPLPGNPVPLWAIFGMIILGIGLIVLSFFVPEDHRRKVLTGGIFVIAAALFFWFVLVFLSIFLKGKAGDNGGGFGSGGFSGGGFSSGGFSGGGGASGGW